MRSSSTITSSRAHLVSYMPSLHPISTRLSTILISVNSSEQGLQVLCKLIDVDEWYGVRVDEEYGVRVDEGYGVRVPGSRCGSPGPGSTGHSG